MRTRRKAAGLFLVVTATLALAGCVQPSPPVIPTSEPSSTPVFATDAAALAAAKTAFTGYVAASNAIGNDGGGNSQRIAQWVTKNRLVTETSEFSKFAKTGDRLSGSATFSKFSLQQFEQSGGEVTLTAYVCDVVAGSRLLDSAGRDITPSSRQDVLPLSVRFRSKSKGSRVLLVDGSDPWGGTNFCS
jgi:hypothetical protein